MPVDYVIYDANRKKVTGQYRESIYDEPFRFWFNQDTLLVHNKINEALVLGRVGLPLAELISDTQDELIKNKIKITKEVTEALEAVIYGTSPKAA